MKIAFLHYHLKTGGVTTVLRQQVEIINDTCDVLLLTGELPESPFPADTIHIPGLGYSEVLKKPDELLTIADSIIRAISVKWKGGCDVLHVHNPLLAKNINLLRILKLIQERQIRLFLQIHDFAEDGRPLAYFSGQYPIDCHYGVINSRDYNTLLKVGLKKEGLHKIPNTIRPLIAQGDITIKNSVLYPIRALRRKNIGEAILLSLFFKNNETLAITLPPNSPADLESYGGWKGYVEEKHLDVEFDAGLRNDFNLLVNSSKFLVTTSISEGFGFSFLEPWTAGKMLWGRKLAGISDDFESNGVQLDHLYVRLLVPVEWIGENTFYEKWKSCILKICTLFNYDIDHRNIKKSFSAITDKGNVDFGLLDEKSQKIIITHVLSSTTNANKLISLNPHLMHLGVISNEEALIHKNRNTVLSCYNKTDYRNNLINIYAGVIKEPIIHSIDKKTLLSHFLDLENFSLLKWGDYAE